MEYKYITDHNLEKRQNYMYSQYYGTEFLKVYRNTRLEYIKKYDDLDIDSSIKTNREESETEIKLKNLNVEDSDLMDAFVKTFEVRKRLYTEYNWENWHPEIHARYDDMELYLLLAENSVEFYRKTKCLRYLNCLLKVNDTLLSECSLLDDFQKNRLCYLLKDEMLFIYNLEKYSMKGGRQV